MATKIKSKYTLIELLEKCDETAPMPEELVNWDNDCFSANCDLKKSKLIEIVSIRLKEAISDTKETRKRLKLRLTI